MAKIGLIDTLISGGIGAIDIAAEELAPDAIVGPLTGPDIYRILVCGGSLIANLVPVREIGGTDTAFYASLPLLEKTIRNLVKGAIAPPAGVVAVRGIRFVGAEGEQKALPTVRLAP